MKQIAKKIAMILIIVIIVNCFTGCELVQLAFTGFVILVVGSLVVGVVVGIITAAIKTHELNQALERRGPRRTNPYFYENKTITTTISSLPKEDIESLSKTLNSMPEKELNLLIGRLNSLSEKESISLINSINTFSVQELAVIVETINSMSETEIKTSLDSVNSLPKTVSLTNIVRDIEVDVSGEKALVGQRARY